MSKTKHNPPRKPKPDFIKFSKIQQAYLIEIRNRQLREFNEAVGSVYEELGITERILKAPPGTYKMRMQDLSGLDVLNVPKEKEGKES